MSWKRYSWKAITCCVSKGMLVLIAIGIGLGLFGLVLKHSKDRSREAAARKIELCNALVERRDAALGEIVWTDHFDDSGKLVGRVGEYQPTDASRAIEAEMIAAGCMEADEEPSKVGPWIATIAFWLCVFWAAAVLLSWICSSSITYCQAAVDTRRPWYYWLPRIGNPLPARQTVSKTCATCQHTEAREETEDEYRARLGLPPLGGADA